MVGKFCFPVEHFWWQATLKEGDAILVGYGGLYPNSASLREPSANATGSPFLFHTIPDSCNFQILTPILSEIRFLQLDFKKHKRFIQVLAKCRD